MKNILFALPLCICLMFSACAAPAAEIAGDEDISGTEPSSNSEGEAVNITEKSFAMYVGDMQDKREITLAFAEDAPDIPLIEINEAAQYLICDVIREKDGQYDMAVLEEGSTVTFSRENGGSCVFDFSSGSMEFSDLSAFRQLSYWLCGVDAMSGTKGFNEQGDMEYIQRVRADGIKGAPLKVDLKELGIPMLDACGSKYILLQTVSDFFLLPHSMNVLFNGDSVFIVEDGDMSCFSDAYYSAPEGDRSEALARVSYAEFCLMMDTFYGLKDGHDITSFDDLITRAGLKEDMLSCDSKKSSDALKKLLYSYLADFHTVPLYNSFYEGKADENRDDSAFVTPSYMAAIKNKTYPKAVRSALMGDDVDFYEEVGDTAFITLDSFTTNSSDHYASFPDETANDTIGMIAYAHSMIMRDESPIRNVVVDLSVNEGGSTDACIYLISWLLGEALISIEDTASHSYNTVMYKADVDLDRVCGENDNISHLSRYCLISNATFSAGNMAASYIKDNGVTLIGDRTAGGACFVLFGTTVDGSLISFSGNERLCTLRNGMYEHIDIGMQPDISLVSPVSYYDRESLLAYIKGLY